MKRLSMNQIILLLVLLIISAVFLSMIRQFLMVILLAGIFSALAQPIYRRLDRWFRGRKALTSITTLVLILLVIFLPLAGLFGIVAGQAIKISRSVEPWIQERIQQQSSFDDWFRGLSFYDSLATYKDVILQRAGELVSVLSNLLIDSLSSATLATVNFIFLFFVFLYTMFFFLKEGHLILERIMYYLPLSTSDEQRMLDKFTSVTRATLKGTLVIGIIQGSLAGLAFWVVGIDSALFWGTVMTFLSIIPAVGGALVWFPAVIILMASGHFVKAIGLWIFCGLLVGSIDNVLRPRLVGRDIKMHELLIFFSTLGGISLFGIIGFILGPIIAALFVTVWEIYGEAFKEFLPAVRAETDQKTPRKNRRDKKKIE